MSNEYIKKHVMELISLALDIQLQTNFPVHTVLNPMVGALEIAIGHEMERRVNLFDTSFEDRLYFFDDYQNEEFLTKYPKVKKKLESYLAVNN